MKQLPDGSENIGTNPDPSVGPYGPKTIAGIVTYSAWSRDRFSLGESDWETYGGWGPISVIGAVAAGAITRSWWGFIGGVALYTAVGVILGLRNRYLERWDPRWRSMRKLRERAQRICETLAAFQLHCGLYREWHREVTLGLRPEDSERAERYYDLLDHARRILEGAILQTIFLEKQVRNGYALLEAGNPPPNLTLELEGVDACAARALPAGDTFDPAQAFRCEEAMERVLDRLHGIRALPEKAR